MRMSNITMNRLEISPTAFAEVVKKIVADNAIVDFSFDDSIFEGIIPKKNITDDVLADKNTVRYWAYSP